MVLESNTYIDISPYHEILSGMNFILSTSVGVIKLTGPAGTGKTRLLQQLETELQAERQEALLFATPPASIKELHDQLSRQLKLDNEFGFNKALIHHVIAKPADRQRLIVMFDDAECIDIDVLLAIALFRNILHDGQPIVSIVLCGSEALNTKLEDSSYRPLVQDLLLSYEIHPLTREQLQAYGNACADIHRLGKLSLKNGVLTALLNESNGLPGPVPELLQRLQAKVASDALTVKVEKAEEEVAVPLVAAVAESEPGPVALVAAVAESEPEPVPVVAAVAESEPEPLPVTTKPAKPMFRMFHKQAPNAVPVAIDTTQLSPDERLILASRAEKEAAAAKAFNIDWARWKPAMQGTAIAAALIVVVVAAWPRIAPTASELYASLTTAPPEAQPAEAIPPPAEVAIEEPAIETPAAPPVVEPAPVVEPVPAPQVASAEPPAPAPTAPQVTRVAGPGITDVDPDELEAVIRDWLMAWQDQDVDDFFSYYHTDFAPLYHNTLSDWRMDRQTKISGPASITIALEDFMVGPNSRIGTRVSFWMIYESPNYADRTLKEVLIGPDVDGQWRILQEYNQQTAPLATRASFTRDESDGVARFLAEWLTAWQNQDVDDYFRHYEPSYKPEFMASSEQWRNERIAKINRPERIVLRMDELEIVESNEDRVRVQLVLEYHSTHYADRTLKDIELRRAASGDWLIAQERNRDVEPLPLMRLLPVDILAFLVLR